MGLQSDINQNFGSPGSSPKFNLHIDSTSIGWGLVARATQPESKNILIAESVNVTLGDTSFNMQNITPAGSITSVDASGQITVDVESLVGGVFSNDTILIYAYDNAGSFDIGFKSSVALEFTPGDPSTYPSDIDYEICELVTTLGMVSISQGAITDVRNTGSLKSFEPSGFSTVARGSIFVNDGDIYEALAVDDDFIYAFTHDSFTDGYLSKFDHEMNHVLSVNISVSSSTLAQFNTLQFMEVDNTTLYIAADGYAVLSFDKATLTLNIARKFDDLAFVPVLEFHGMKILNDKLFVMGQKGEAFNRKGFLFELDKTTLSIINSFDFRESNSATTTSDGLFYDLTTDGIDYWILSRSTNHSNVIKVDSVLSPIEVRSSGIGNLSFIEYNTDGNLSVFTTQAQYTFDTSYNLLDSDGSDQPTAEDNGALKSYFEGEFYFVTLDYVSKSGNTPYRKGVKAYSPIAGSVSNRYCIHKDGITYIAGGNNAGGSGIGAYILQVRNFETGYFSTSPSGFIFDDEGVDQAVAPALTLSAVLTPSYNTLTITETDITGNFTINPATPTLSSIYTTIL